MTIDLNKNISRFFNTKYLELAEFFLERQAYTLKFKRACTYAYINKLNSNKQAKLLFKRIVFLVIFSQIEGKDNYSHQKNHFFIV
jgi:hypothetical protein